MQVIGFVLGVAIGGTLGLIFGGTPAWIIGGGIVGGLAVAGTVAQQQDDERHKAEVENLLRDIKNNKGE